MTRRHGASVLAAGIVLLCLGLPACTSSTDGAALTVSAASSLTGSFTRIGTAFEQAHPGVTVTFNFAGSSALADQIAAGAPVDVFASASAAPMETVVASGRSAGPLPFATNSLAVAVPPSNPANLTQLADIAKAGVTVAVCHVAVPCGAAAATLFQRSALDVTPVTLEPDVKSVLAKVAADEVDAGIVYITDIAAAGTAVASIRIPADANVMTTYVISEISDSAQTELAREFVEFVVGPDGQRSLMEAGFGSR